MRKLADIIFANENTGDFSGAGTFQGGPYGFGNRYQLASSEIWPGLVDPAEDLPNNPSMWPAVRAQKDSDRDKYDSLESPEVYDDRTHLLPGEDEVRDQILDPEADVEPSYYYTPDYVNERGPSDILYRDLPGFPAMNTLAGKKDHIPEDEDPDRDPDDPEEERYNIPNVLPTPREKVRGEPFGYGHYEDETNLTLSRDSSDTNMFDPMNPDADGKELNLNKKRNRSLNRWKETEKENLGHTNRDQAYNHITNQQDHIGQAGWLSVLVKPENYIKKEFGQQDYKKELDEPDDVPLAAGYSGVVVNPVKHVPGPIYKSRNTLAESKTMAGNKTKTPTKRKLEKFVPKDLDKSSPEKTYGRGMGQILKQYDHYPEDFDAKDIKPLDPLPKEDPMIPYTYDPSKIVTIIQTKLLEKLSKLANKK